MREWLAFARSRSQRAGLLLDAVLSVAVYVASYRMMVPYMNPSLWGLRGKQHFWGDEGTVLHHANRILHGEVLYRDFFDFQGLFGFLPFTFGFAIGGATPSVGRLTMIVLMSLWCSVLYLTVKEITLKRWAGIFVAFYFALCVWPSFPYAYQHFIADLWLTCALLFAIWGEREKLSTGWLWGGVFLALATWTSLSEGGPAVFLLLFTCALMRYARRDGPGRLLQLVQGFVTVTFFYSLYLIATRSLRVAVHDVLVFPFQTYGLENATEYAFDGAGYVDRWKSSPHGETVGRMVTMTMEVPKVGIFVSLLVALFLVERVAYSRYHRRVRSKGIPWATLSACILAASLGGLAIPVVRGVTRNDICHLGFVQQTSVLALCALWAPISKDSLKKLRWKLVLAVQLLFGGYVALIDYRSWQFLREIAHTAENATVKTLDEDAFAHFNCRGVRARTRPEDTVVIHYGGMGYLACERKSAISFPHLFHAPYWQDQWPQAAREIAARKPRVMWISTQDWYRFTSDQPILRSLYFPVEGGSYVLTQGRPGPPLVLGRWRYSITHPPGHVVHGVLDLERAEAGPTSFRATFDDGEKSAVVHTDATMVQLFDGPTVYALERDETGTKMSGFVFEGGSRYRVFDAELEAAPP